MSALYNIRFCQATFSHNYYRLTQRLLKNLNFLEKQTLWIAKQTLLIFFKVSDMIHNNPPKPTLILVTKVYPYFSDFCGEILCEYFKYFRRNQRKCCLGNQTIIVVTSPNKTINNISTMFSYNFLTRQKFAVFSLCMGYLDENLSLSASLSKINFSKFSCRALS